MRTETVQVGVAATSTMFACPNRALDPTGVVANQRWRREGNCRNEWAVVDEPDQQGDVRLAQVGAPRPTYVTVSVGTLLAYWTCLDVPG